MKHRLTKTVLMALLALSVFFTPQAVCAATLEAPQYPALQLEKNQRGDYDSFAISWKNPAWVKKALSAGKAVQFEIDGNVDDANWSSAKGNTWIGTLNKSQSENVKLTIPSGTFPELGKPDIENHLYSFRIRYKTAKSASDYTNPVSVGYKPSFINASSWSKSELNAASDSGLIPASVKADMKQDITREEFTEVILRVYEKTTKTHLVAGKSPYKDVNNDAVTIATRLGIVNGTGKGNFSPNAKITRQDMATILNRLLKTLNIEEKKISVAPFVDDKHISNYAKTSVYRLNDLGLMKGYKDNTFKPKNNATREEGVVLGQRIYDYVN